ncbi:MAG: hypothetical protein P9L99_00550 [Candidatus Lernaella stagnicola]|nr:hypothetical protein [Candidatus Lernaella stagnicola]
MKMRWYFFAMLIVVCLSFTTIIACGDDDDDDSGDDDAGPTGGADCQSLCERGLECFGEEYWDYAGVETMDECVEVCENDLSEADPELIDCIFGCAGISGCDEWGACMAECAA